MQRLEVSDAVRPIYESLGVKRLIQHVTDLHLHFCYTLFFRKPGTGSYFGPLFNPCHSSTPYSLGKGKSVPLQVRSGPEGSRKLRLPNFMTTAQDSGKVVSLTHRPPLSPGNTPGTHFC